MLPNTQITANKSQSYDLFPQQFQLNTTPKTFKTTKTKINIEPSLNPFITISNDKKRKLNEYNNNILTYEPNKKRPKLNDNNLMVDITEKVTKLMQSNDLLSAHNFQLQKEANEWKYKYTKLYSDLYSIINSDNTIPLILSQMNTTHNIISKNHTMPQNIVSNCDNGTHINPIVLTEINNNKNISPPSINKTISKSNLIPKNIVSEQKHNAKDNKKVSNKASKVATTNNISEFIEYENSYYVSVTCYICNKHFNDINLYKTHLQNHYETDINKTWLVCNFDGCNYKDKGKDDFRFIGHISTHTKDKPYKCSVIINGIKCNGSIGHKHDFKKHWKTHFPNHIKTNTPKTTKNKTKNKKIVTKNKNKNKNKNKRKMRVRKQSNKENMNTDNILFENSYYISINCHICSEHFSDIFNYKQHLEYHYKNDINKQWLKCDFGCKNMSFKAYPDLICHIASHTKSYPWKCCVKTNGKKCEFTSGTKSNIKVHFNRMHKNNIKINKNKNEFESETSVMRSELSDFNNNNKYNDFENSFCVSVNCYLCKKYFDDFGMYKKHMKKHYENDRDKQWLKCNFGCMEIGKVNEGRILKDCIGFISHIASHSNDDYPFKCNLCNFGSGTKGNMKTHWNVKHRNRNESSESEWESDNEFESELDDWDSSASYYTSEESD